MFKFITVTCLLLFFVFYELSGGSDFVPLSERRAAEALTGEPGAAPDVHPVLAAQAATADMAGGTDTPDFARTGKSEAMARNVVSPAGARQPEGVVLASASAGASALPASVNGLPLARVDKAVATPRETQPPLGLNALIEENRSAAQAEEERAIADAVTPQEAAANVPQMERAQPAKDIRAVTGNLVNLRLGPGTGYAVIAKLAEGDDVEVIGGTGNWLKLRVSDTGRIGWMADWLVTAAAG